MLRKFLSWFFEVEIGMLACDQHDAWIKEQQRREQEIKAMIAGFAVGTPVICIGNEWKDPTIGFVTRIELLSQAKTPTLVVLDELTGNELIVMSAAYDFTGQRLQAFMKLSPYERWVMACRSGFDGHRDLTRDDLLAMAFETKKLLTEDDVYEKLDATGFFTRVDAFNAKRIAEQAG